MPLTRSSPARSNVTCCVGSTRVQRRPRRSDHGTRTSPIRHTAAQVGHDQPPHVALPAPRHQVVVPGVSGPTGKLTQLPPSLPQARLGQYRQERPVEPLHRGVRRFVRIPAEEHRKVNLPTFDLTVVDQPHPGLGESGDGGRLPAGRAERGAARGSSWFSTKRTRRADSRGRPEGAGEPPAARPAPAGRRAACRSSSRSPAAAAPTPGPSTPRPRRRSRSRCRTSAIRVGQYSAAGSGPTASPQVRANTSS